MEQGLQLHVAPTPEGGGTPFSSAVAAALEGKLAEISGATAPDAPQVPQVPQAPQTPPQAPAPQPPVPPQLPTAAPSRDDRPVVSTNPVGDVASRFVDRPAPAPTSAGAPGPVPEAREVPEPEEMTDKAKYAWQELRGQLRQYKGLAQQYKDQLDKAVHDGEGLAAERSRFADEIKAREDRIAELEDRVGKLDLESNAAFQEQYDRPISGLVDQVSAVLSESAEIPQDKLEEVATNILTADDAAFNRMVAKLPAAVQGSFLDKRVQFARLDAAREHALQEWRSTQDGTQTVAEQERVAERAVRRRELAQSAIDYTTKMLPPDERPAVLSESTYADDVASVNRQFADFMQVAKEQDLSRAAYQGFLVPVMQRQLAYMTDAMTKWRDYAYALRGAGAPPASPMRVVGASAPVAMPPVEPKVVDGQNFGTTVQNTVEGLLSRFSRQ